MKQTGSLLTIFLILGYFVSMTFATPESDLNVAMEDLVDSVMAQLPEGLSGERIALIPVSATAPKLKIISHVLTSLLSSRLSYRVGESFAGMDRADWHRFRTDDGLLLPKQVKRYATSLECQWLITGRVTDLSSLIVVQVFLWDAGTGDLRYVADSELLPSASLVALYPTESDANFQPYFAKWRSLPDMDYFALAIEVADVDGDGFNELVVADERRVKVLKWSGFNFWRQADLPEIQYGDDETPTRDRARRRMLSADHDGDDRDEIYIGWPPDRTWQVEWNADKQTTTAEQRPVFLAQGRGQLIVGRTKADTLFYQGYSTNCWVWDTGKIQSKYPCPLPVDYHSISARLVDVDDTTSQIALVDLKGHLQMYRMDNSTTELVWQTPPVFGKGLAVGDVNGDDILEIVCTVGNFPAPTPSVDRTDASDFFDQFIVLARSGDWYVERWKSPLLEGRIIDMKIADADNDDRNELIICLRSRKGSQIQLYSAAD